MIFISHVKSLTFYKNKTLILFDDVHYIFVVTVLVGIVNKISYKKIGALYQ